MPLKIGGQNRAPNKNIVFDNCNIAQSQYQEEFVKKQSTKENLAIDKYTVDA